MVIPRAVVFFSTFRKSIGKSEHAISTPLASSLSFFHDHLRSANMLIITDLRRNLLA